MKIRKNNWRSNGFKMTSMIDSLWAENLFLSPNPELLLDI